MYKYFLIGVKSFRRNFHEQNEKRHYRYINYESIVSKSCYFTYICLCRKNNDIKQSTEFIKISNANYRIEKNGRTQITRIFPETQKTKIDFENNLKLKVAPTPEFEENTILVIDKNQEIVNVLEVEKRKANTTALSGCKNIKISVSNNSLLLENLVDEEYVLTSHPTYNEYAGKLTKSEAINVRNKIKQYKSSYDYVAFAMGLLHPGWSVVGWFGSREFSKLIDKYIYAIDHVTTSKPHIAVYHVMVWRNGGKNSGYICRDQILKNVK